MKKKDKTNRYHPDKKFEVYNYLSVYINSTFCDAHISNPKTETMFLCTCKSS